MRKVPDAAVITWLDRQPTESIWITSVTLFEARLGLALLPDGKRRAALIAAFARLLEEDLENASWISTRPLLSKPPNWPQNGRRPGGRWTCATLKSQGLHLRGVRSSPRATCDISSISKSRWSILGWPPCASCRRTA